MNFDFILMNPPYDGSLHLKILEYSKTKTKNSCINLSPIRWIIDPLADFKKSDYKKFAESIRYYIKDLDIITVNYAQESFGARIPIDLGIYTVTNEKQNNPYECPFVLAKSLAAYIFNNKCPIDYNKKDGWRVRLPSITCSTAGNKDVREVGLSVLKCYDGLHDGKPWYTFFSRNQNTKETPEISCSVKFETEQECDNFINSLKLDLIRYYMQKAIISIDYLNPLQVLWLGNLTNPRTKLVGYKSEWTNEDLYKAFNITDKDKTVINETLNQFN